jgi:outer membrane protein OmpA-like peptidoglycan-associated protein
MKSKALILKSILFSITLLLLCPWVNASELDVTDYGGQMPSTDEFIMALDPEMGVRMRSISSSSEPAKLRSVSLGIQFKRDSFELTEGAQEVLNRLGGALSSPKLSQHRFMIEGHTDANGSTAYNQDLSEKRAMSVKNYLVNVFDIASSRLDEAGKGETALLNASDPGSSANRRVQIINLAQ